MAFEACISMHHHLGTSALTTALLRRGERARSRVGTVTFRPPVSVASPSMTEWAKATYDRVGRPTSQSKLANVMFALECRSGCRQPAAADLPWRPTRPGPHLPLQRRQGPPTLRSWKAWPTGLMDPLFQSAAMGALPQLHAATAAEAKAGEHFRPDQLVRGNARLAAGLRVGTKGLNAEDRRQLWERQRKRSGCC